MVIRTDKAGQLKNSKPCYHCLSTLKLFNIRYVYFSTDEGIIEKHKVSEFCTEHYSGGQKRLQRIMSQTL